jgi:DNA-binding transcriptional MerR regulator
MSPRKQKKLYYKIGEACKLLDIQPYVLRYWETEFPELSPSKSKSGQRVYSEKELETIRRIKGLLYDEGYTIAGAKKKLEESPEPDDEDDGENGSSEPSDGLDSGAAEQVQIMRQGIAEALDDARELLALLNG